MFVAAITTCCSQTRETALSVSVRVLLCPCSVVLFKLIMITRVLIFIRAAMPVLKLHHVFHASAAERCASMLFAFSFWYTLILARVAVLFH